MAQSEHNKRVVGVKSSTLAIFEGVFAGIIGLGIAIFRSIANTADITQETDSLLAGLTLGLASGIVAILVLPFIYFLFGWIIGYVHGFVFNVVAEGSGGIVFTLLDNKDRR